MSGSRAVLRRVRRRVALFYWRGGATSLIDGGSAESESLSGARGLGGAERVVKRADNRPDLVARDAVVDRLAVAPGRDESFESQSCELLRYGRLAQLQELFELPDRFLARQEIAQVHEARRVRTRLHASACFFTDVVP